MLRRHGGRQMCKGFPKRDDPAQPRVRPVLRHKIVHLHHGPPRQDRSDFAIDGGGSAPLDVGLDLCVDVGVPDNHDIGGVIDHRSRAKRVMRMAVHDDLNGFLADVIADGLTEVLSLFLVVTCVVDDQPVFGFDHDAVADRVPADAPDAVGDLFNFGRHICDVRKRFQNPGVGDRPIRCGDKVRRCAHVNRFRNKRAGRRALRAR